MRRLLLMLLVVAGLGSLALAQAPAEFPFAFMKVAKTPPMGWNSWNKFGCDVRAMSADTKAILTNADVLALDQDPMGKQGRRIRDDGELEVWAKWLQSGDVAVALRNRSKQEKEIGVAWTEIGLGAAAAPQVRNLWTKQDLGAVTSVFSATVPSHDVVPVRVTPGK